MALQEDGWPLGLQLLSVRVGLTRNREFSGSISFSTLLTGSPSSFTDTSSDLDTESTGSFFHEKSITLGNLIGVSSVLELTSRTGRARRYESTNPGKKQYHKVRRWFSLCTKAVFTNGSPNNSPSLGHFLEVERRTANACRRNPNSMISDELDEVSGSQSAPQSNSLFIDGQVAPPLATNGYGSHISKDGDQSAYGTPSSNVETPTSCCLSHGNEHGSPLLLACICRQC